MVKGRSFPPKAPYLVAAIDYNHDGNLALGRRLVSLAADCGAHAVKFAIRRLADSPASEAPGAPRSRPSGRAVLPGELRRQLELTPAAFASLRKTAQGRVAFVAAPYDRETLRLALRLKPDVLQIDPPVLGDLDLVRAVGRARLPVLLAIGMCTETAVAAALRELRRAPVVLLHTVSALPVSPDRSLLGYIPALRKRWKRPVGYCGWEPGTTWCIVAAALGAQVIEKPFTLDRSLDGPFHGWSLDPAQFRALAADLRDLSAAVRPVSRRTVLAEELDVLGSDGQSLVARRRLARGRRLRSADFRLQAPVGGLGPRLWRWIEGRRLLYDLEAGEPVTFGMIE